jgi:predicted transcriptional regulator
MANYNLTNQPISASFQQLLQKDDDTNYLVDGTGSIVDSLEITGSLTASFFKGDGSALTNVTASGVSIDTGSLLETASFDNGTRNMTFTKGDAVNIPDATVDTGSLLVTASVVDATTTYTKGNGDVFTTTINNVANATSASLAILAEQAIDVFITVKNTSGGIINKGLAVHATGVTGENINVILADSSISANMPAIGLLEETLGINATGRAVIGGRLKNIDTSTLVAGEAVYVNGAGVLTANKPTGSDLIQSIGVAG